MTQSDLDLLVSMGFERPRAEMAVKQSGGLQGALSWLEANQDKSLQELLNPGAAAGEDEEGGPSIAELEGGDSAKSLVCNDCGKMFRTHAQASFHASKTEHTDFSESTEELAPLTEEQKRLKLQELREKLQEKRAGQAVQDKEVAKRNEQIRLKATKETQDMKEELQRKEQIKEAARKRLEKHEDLEAKRRIKAKIEADKAERKRKQDEAKAAREGRPLQDQEPGSSSIPVAAAAASSSSSSSSSANKPTHAEARLKLQMASGSVVKTFPAETTVCEVASQIEAETGTKVTSFMMMGMPRKTLELGPDFGQTLREAGLTPSAVLVVR